MAVTPFDGVRAIRQTPPQTQPNIVTQELPAHLVPPHIVAVTEVPYTLNGKVDLAALPDPPVAGQ